MIRLYVRPYGRVRNSLKINFVDSKKSCIFANEFNQREGAGHQSSHFHPPHPLIITTNGNGCKREMTTHIDVHTDDLEQVIRFFIQPDDVLERDVEVNVSKLADVYNKNVADWLMSDECKSLVSLHIRQSASKSNDPDENIKDMMIALNYLSERDGYIYLRRPLAIAFARWLSPKFNAWCNYKLDALLDYGRIWRGPLSANEENEFSTMPDRELCDLANNGPLERYEQFQDDCISREYFSD